MIGWIPRKCREILMSDILIVAEHGRHDAAGEVIQGSSCEDSLAPGTLLLVLWVRCFIIFLASEH